MTTYSHIHIPTWVGLERPNQEDVFLRLLSIWFGLSWPDSDSRDCGRLLVVVPFWATSCPLSAIAFIFSSSSTVGMIFIR